MAISGGVDSTRGTVFAAVALLKRLGFRFFAPDETFAPTADAIAAAVAGCCSGGGAFDRSREGPALIWRSMESFETNGADPAQSPPTGTAAQMQG